ncbi:MAG: GTPase HflX [Oligoflexus sp.]
MTQKRKTAVLAAIQLPGESDTEHMASLAELSRLVTTLGFDVVGQISQKRKAAASGTVFGEGKLKELAAFTGGKGFVAGFSKNRNTDDEASDHIDLLGDGSLGDHVKAEVVVFDLELTPGQLKNLEEATGVEVLDRTGVILEIFSKHARSREARLQVEIAKLGYLAPRLRASNLGADRQGGGIGAKGAGETAHELDKRRIRDRIAELKQQLQGIQKEQDTRRSHRQDVPTVALVGYTNAGKSSLMRALTGSEVLVADKLFATLDTTVRSLHPETTPRILISDTVGFIKKLPHDLVASFRSTLDEALSASLLLFTVDASDPTFRSQLEVTKTVLNEIGADKVPSRLVLNKMDRLDSDEITSLQAEFPDSILISTKNPQDVQRVHGLILDFFEQGMQDVVYTIPYEKGFLTGEIRSRARVIRETFEDEGTVLTIRAHAETHSWLEKKLCR